VSRSLRVGTRGSALALWQAHFVAERLRQAAPGCLVELRVIKTKGDAILDTPLAKIGGKGLFVKEIEESLLSGATDLAVHSMKDVPAGLAPGLCLAAVAERADPADALCLRLRGGGLATLPAGARVGTSSVRRAAQLLALRKDLAIAPLRGNVDTRLRKLDDGQHDAIVLAVAGLGRLGHADRVSERLEPPRFLPAIGQGAIGVETRADDEVTRALVRAALHHERDAACVAAERAFGARLGGSCQTPLGAHARQDGDDLVLCGLVARLDGTEILRGEARGLLADPVAVGHAVADELRARGADRILAAAGAE
jgi:hydroxymethylbilane synthase